MLLRSLRSADACCIAGLGTRSLLLSVCLQDASVLQLVVQHDQQRRLDTADICRLLLVSQSVRQALQQAVGHLRVLLRAAHKVAPFAWWLLQHAGLVEELLFQNCPAGTEQVLAFAFKECVQQTPQAAAAGMGSECKPAACQLRRLRLWFEEPAVLHHLLRPLAALTSLTRLEAVGAGMPSHATCAALAQLASLKVLCLMSRDEHQEVNPWLGSAVGQLQQLTALYSDVILPLDALQQLPASLQHLQTSVAAGSAPAVLQLQHLRALSELSLDAPGGVAGASSWPPLLRSLTQLTGSQVVSVLPQLHQLHLNVPHSCAELLEQLPAASSLSKLALCLDGCNNLTLPGVLRSVARATQLVELRLLGSDDDPPAPKLNLHGMQLSNKLKGLPRLRELLLLCLDLDYGDALGLRHLTSLTSLSVTDVKNVGDTALVAIIGALTNLRRLHLSFDTCELQSDCLWAVLGQATTLECVEVDDPPTLTDDTLQLLLPLVNLKTLFVGEAENRHELTEAAVAAFQAAMPCLNSCYIGW